MTTLTANFCRSHLGAPPAHSRLPPDGHEFPPDCNDPKNDDNLNNNALNKNVVNRFGSHRLASKSHSALLSSEIRLLRHDEKSVKSVRDKIALFSNNNNDNKCQSSEDVNKRVSPPPLFRAHTHADVRFNTETKKETTASKGIRLRSQKSVSSADLFSACNNVRRVSQRFTTIPSDSPIITRTAKPASSCTQSATATRYGMSSSTAQRSQSLMEIGLAGLATLAGSIGDNEKHSQTLPKRCLISTPTSSKKRLMVAHERKTSLNTPKEWQMPKFEDELPLVLTAQPWRDSYRIKRLEEEDKENQTFRVKSSSADTAIMATKQVHKVEERSSDDFMKHVHSVTTPDKKIEPKVVKEDVENEDSSGPTSSQDGSEDSSNSDATSTEDSSQEDSDENEDNEDGEDLSNDNGRVVRSEEKSSFQSETTRESSKMSSFDAFEGGRSHSRLLDTRRSHVRNSNSSVETCKSSFAFIGKPASRSSSFSFADKKRSTEGFQPYHKTSEWRRRSQESLWSSRHTLTEDKGCISSLLSSEDTIGEEQEMEALVKNNSSDRPETEGGSRDTTPTRTTNDGWWSSSASDKLQLSRTSSLSSEKSPKPSKIEEEEMEEQEELLANRFSSSSVRKVPLKQVKDQVDLEMREFEITNHGEATTTTFSKPLLHLTTNEEKKDEDDKEALLSEEGIEWASFDPSIPSGVDVKTMSTPVDSQNRLLAPLVFRPDEALRSPNAFKIGDGDLSSSSSVFLLDENSDNDSTKSSNEPKKNIVTNITSSVSTRDFNAAVATSEEVSNRRCVSVNDIRQAFEKAEASLATKKDEGEEENLANKSSSMLPSGMAPSHHRMSSLDSTASDESSSIPTPIFFGSVSSLPSQTNVRDHYGSISSLASSTSLISPQELQMLIEDANQSLEESGTPSHEIMVVVLHREFTAGSLGITLAGGADYESKEITVHKVIPGTLADRDGRIQKGDRVLSINGKSTKGVTHREALTTLKAPRPEVVLVVSRSRSVTPALEAGSFNDRSDSFSSPSSLTSNNSFTINLSSASRPPKILESPLDSKSLLSELKFVDVPRGPPMTVMLTKEGTGLGFSLEGGKDSPVGDRPLTIKKIFAGGSAAKSKVLNVGDEIIAVNSVDCTGMSRIEAWNFMKTLPDGTAVITVRQKIVSPIKASIPNENIEASAETCKSEQETQE